SYLDEAERCGVVLLLNQGKVLYDGPPKELTAKVEGRSFLIQGAGTSRRKTLTSALKSPNVVDGVVQGKSVRLVIRAGAPPPDAAALQNGPVEITPTAPRFEDAFVDLLGGSTKDDSPLSGAVHRSAEETIVDAQELTKKFGDFTAAERITFRI